MKINKKIIKDSKLLSKNKREILEKYIKKNSFWAIGYASKIEIEKLNVLNASLLAMKRAINKLKKKPGLILIDGNKAPSMDKYKIKSIIKYLIIFYVENIENKELINEDDDLKYTNKCFLTIISELLAIIDNKKCSNFDLFKC